MEITDAAELLEHQSGVVSRRQLLEHGAADFDLRRWVRTRQLRRVHPGVYVSHTGPLTWENRAWAAVLLHWPAALTHQSCIDRTGETIHVAVDAARTPSSRAGIRVHRLVGLANRVQWHLGPPRVHLEDALLGVCDGVLDRTRALALVSDACRRRVTTPGRLADELARHQRVRHRAWLREVLHDAAIGVQSLLEHTYERRVERAHGLPRAERQVREHTADGVVYRDATYRQYGVVVELDGRLGHELSRDRWNDQDRDLLVAAEAVVTLRLGWRHCDQTPCRTASRLGRVLQRRGWTGRPHGCGPTCSLPGG